MNKKIIFDIQFGASGDMLLGAMLDLADETERLRGELSKLNLKNWEISPLKIVKYHMSGTLANVKCSDDDHSRSLGDIRKIISGSSLKEDTGKNIIKIFERLAAAESAVHGVDIEKIHFHEIGAVDSIIDISAFCVMIDLLGIKEILFNDFCFGRGSVTASHGEIPVPVPAVVELSRGFRMRTTDRIGENITPTAAAILTSLGRQIKGGEGFTVLGRGTGFGTRGYEYPSYTRAILIETDVDQETVVQLECNIDDMNPQLNPHIIEKLLNAGALDAYFSQISMKKGRTGSLLTVISPGEISNSIKDLIYRNTTTLGIRSTAVEREKLKRSFDSVVISGREIKIKIACLNGEVVNIQPEFEDCRTASEKTGIPLKEIMARAVAGYLGRGGKEKQEK